MRNFTAVALSGGFSKAYRHIGRTFLTVGEPVDTGHWQALSGVPQTKTVELQNVCFDVAIDDHPDGWGRSVVPTGWNVAKGGCWAELQFQERVGGEPLNPGETFTLWPWYRGNVEQHKAQGQFSHTYMERFWPKHANAESRAGAANTLPSGGIADTTHFNTHTNWGIRYRYGDLNDLLDLLVREPYTRQAYLPIFFPEDTGAHHGERIPCTLGYHLMLRDGRLHIFYPIRSCDFLRHFRDDVYMAGRLVQWVIEQMVQLHKDRRSYDYELWMDVKPGNLTFHAVSMHVFEGDMARMEKDYGWH